MTTDLRFIIYYCKKMLSFTNLNSLVMPLKEIQIHLSA
jgi:hypothetical protein